MTKFISWNVNGIRAAIKKGFLDFVEKYNPDILCLQETKARPEQVELELSRYPFKYWNWAEKKGYSGTATFSKIEPLNIGANNPLGLNMEQQRRDAIARTFHVDQLLITENRNMTATEVMQRNEEKMRILGPVLGRLQSELLQPLIIRVFNVMLRKNLFSPAPQMLQQQEIQIEYVSPAQLAQKSSELQSITRALEIFGSISQVVPIQDWLDESGLVKHLQSTLGLPAKLMKSESEVTQIREQKAAQAQQQAEQQQAEEGGGGFDSEKGPERRDPGMEPNASYTKSRR